MDGSVANTRISLLVRLREDPADQQAWAEFVERYGRKVFAWCRVWKLQPADAEDVTQEVLVILSRRLRTFDYDPARSFRAWLKTVTQHAWNDWHAARQRPGGGSGDSAVRDQLEQVEARNDLLRHLETAFDQEVLEEAETRVRARVQPHTWEAFQLLAREGLTGEEVARRLGMRSGAVFVAKSKVLKMLQEEIRHLNQ